MQHRALQSLLVVGVRSARRARLAFGVGSVIPPSAAASSPTQIEEWQLELYRLQRAMRQERRRQDSEVRNTLVADLLAAKKEGRAADTQRLVRMLAGTGVGTKKRIIGRLPCSRPSTEAVKASALSPASEGGSQRCGGRFCGRSC